MRKFRQYSGSHDCIIIDDGLTDRPSLEDAEAVEKAIRRRLRPPWRVEATHCPAVGAFAAYIHVVISRK